VSKAKAFQASFVFFYKSNLFYFTLIIAMQTGI
jgi:hypothetical protein